MLHCGQNALLDKSKVEKSNCNCFSFISSSPDSLDFINNRLHHVVNLHKKRIVESNVCEETRSSTPPRDNIWTHNVLLYLSSTDRVWTTTSSWGNKHLGVEVKAHYNTFILLYCWSSWKHLISFVFKGRSYLTATITACLQITRLSIYGDIACRS